jgi:hypothetical protein
MPANAQPIFILTPNVGMARITAGNTASDGTGTLFTAFTAGTNGSRIESVTFTNSQTVAAASTAMVGKVFVTDASGSNPMLLQEITMPTITRTTAVIGQSQTIFFGTGLLLKSGQLIKVATSIYNGAQDQVDVIVRGGDY